jgi:hypothetical protein
MTHFQSLSSALETGTSKLFAKYGAFFAFGEKQFNEQKKEGVKYIADGSGLLIPKDNYDAFVKEYNNLKAEAVAEHVAKYGADQIIRYEYFNHEQQLDLYYGKTENSDTYNALKVYLEYPGFELENIERVFLECWREAVEKDLF